MYWLLKAYEKEHLQQIESWTVVLSHNAVSLFLSPKTASRLEKASCGTRGVGILDYVHFPCHIIVAALDWGRVRFILINRRTKLKAGHTLLLGDIPLSQFMNGEGEYHYTFRMLAILRRACINLYKINIFFLKPFKGTV